MRERAINNQDNKNAEGKVIIYPANDQINLTGNQDWASNSNEITSINIYGGEALRFNSNYSEMVTISPKEEFEMHINNSLITIVLNNNSTLKFTMQLNHYILNNEYATCLEVKGKLKVLPQVCDLIIDKLNSANISLNVDDCQLLKAYQSIDKKILQLFLAQNYKFYNDTQRLNEEINKHFLSLTVCKNPNLSIDSFFASKPLELSGEIFKFLTLNDIDF